MEGEDGGDRAEARRLAALAAATHYGVGPRGATGANLSKGTASGAHRPQPESGGSQLVTALLVVGILVGTIALMITFG